MLFKSLVFCKTTTMTAKHEGRKSVAITFSAVKLKSLVSYLIWKFFFQKWATNIDPNVSVSVDSLNSASFSDGLN